MNYNLTLTDDGIYDENGNLVLLDELIESLVNKGIKVERKTEIRKIYKKDSEGKIITESSQCEVVTFSP